MDNWLHKEIRLFVNELIVCSLNKLVQLSAIHFSKKITPKQSRGSKITQKNCKNVSLRYLQCFCGINYKLSFGQGQETWDFYYKSWQKLTVWNSPPSSMETVLGHSFFPVLPLGAANNCVCVANKTGIIQYLLLKFAGMS